jgi:hypothetical protein
MYELAHDNLLRRGLDGWRQFLQTLNPILRIATNLIHQATGGSVRWFQALLPILHGTGRYSQELCEDRLARAQLSPGLFHIFGCVLTGHQAQANRATGKALCDILTRFRFAVLIIGM